MNYKHQKTKIIATVGPASWSISVLQKLIIAGVDVFRINFSHGDHARHDETITNIRRAEKRLGRPVAVLADLQGPRVRIGKLDHERELKRGEVVHFAAAGFSVKNNMQPVVPVSHARFAADVHRGARILIADGEIELVVRSVSGGVVSASVVCGGVLKSSKGINLPDCNISIPTLTKKDHADLAFAASRGVDAVAVSFVGSAADIEMARKLIKKAGSDAIVIAKMERALAIENQREILEASDGVMVARGDLAVEVGYENVPVLQKELIEKSIALARPVMVATQMLDSMMEHPRPTRAEASDVANAIFDGADAVMLSGETAVGSFPIETVRAMARIIQKAEEHIEGRCELQVPPDPLIRRECAIAKAAVHAAAYIGAKCIVPFTTSGRSARFVSRERSSTSIVSFGESERAMRRLSFYWGVRPACLKTAHTMTAHFRDGERRLVAGGAVAKGDSVVFLAGLVKVPGATNTLRIHRVGDPIA